MTTQIANPSSTRSVGAPPPFDPELAPVAEVLAGLRAADAYRPDNILEPSQCSTTAMLRLRLGRCAAGGFHGFDVVALRRRSPRTP
ncbi:hypothetical protein Kisp01_36330 [Kineosporia sp. NBRC 101677]|uniref:hypothetical protein n=1 Tax=Kineosporia sp. NBRC 101677 TaxID=3032197 RepID=UPI0024A46FDF|nr:hypothetical protein [Kineosporia sp. NBRC 101677]GLY16618.1 hypothetical protein Kisp01_36330 [Kineosporia sp. NBRC 101677]